LVCYKVLVVSQGSFSAASRMSIVRIDVNSFREEAPKIHHYQLCII